jgi:hypothetical protein
LNTEPCTRTLLKSASNIILIFILLCMTTSASAQFDQCVDSGRISRYYQCLQPEFTPVCGCNQVTYRNECEAFRKGGVNLVHYDGVCQNDYMFSAIYPSNVRDIANIYVQFYDKGPLTIQIRDSYGKLMLTQNHLNLHNRQFDIPVNSYTVGVYFVFLISGGSYNIQKFIKY